jgi:hypothetical protein
MKKEVLLIVISSAITILTALWLIKWIAPQLLGGSSDMQIVQVDKKVPPFYEGVFRRQDITSEEFILQDPYTRVRAKPLFPNVGIAGPNDILGFRNHAVPNVSDVVVIGDSQTYGNNATLEESWPGQLNEFLNEQISVYSMATGGWGAVQYLDMFTNATVFQPRVVVIAYYSGNDSLESFAMAYGVEPWNKLIPDPSLTSSDAPKVTFPAPQSQWWPVSFSDNVKTIFTPTLRLASNQKHPAVKAGYEIMANIAKRITTMAEPIGLPVVFTVIPTKELVYVKKIQKEGLEQPEDYKTLVHNEEENIHWLEEKIRVLPGATYIDMVHPLQEAAAGPSALYPDNIDGHPINIGYRVISQVIAKEVQSLLPPQPQGLVGIMIGNDQAQLALVSGRTIRYFKSPDIAKNNGWSLDKLPLFNMRDIVALRILDEIDEVDPDRYGPK